MVRQGRGGVIINISSTSGVNGGGVSIPHYAASKHGVIGLTRQMALEFAPHGIRTLAVAPNVIVTEGVRHAKEKTVAAAGFELDVEKSLLGRAGVPDDVARVVLFAASDMAAFMTGSTLFVDAGSTARG
jgi:NAD(P)-dependent dehydrogenase (short-subunit alcohol dehydrogenase family)